MSPRIPDVWKSCWRRIHEGFLTPLNAGINSRIKRGARQTPELLPPPSPPTTTTYKSGSLFQKEASS